MKKLKVGLLLGGKSGEHEVSLVSAMSISRALDKDKYDVELIGIDPDGRWCLLDAKEWKTHDADPRAIRLSQEKKMVTLLPFRHQPQIIGVDQNQNVPVLDVIFPILHGTNGEDGTVQGLLDLAQIPYVGSGVLGSALCMDKEVSRRLLKAAGIPVVDSQTIYIYQFDREPAKVLEQVAARFGYPYFVKPVNAGSSVGVHKVKSREQAETMVRDAFLYDRKVLVEKAVAARELEVSVLGNEEPRASIIGEIVPKHEFYSYEAKYMDDHGAELCIPARNVSAELSDRIRQMAVQAFTCLECRGLARIDFFLDRDTNELFLNELNTMPGFTSVSMYPKLWEATGLPYSKLLDELIRLAVLRYEERANLKTTYAPK